MDEKLKKKQKNLKFQKTNKTSNNFGLMSNLFSRFEILIKKNNRKGGLDWNPLYTLFQG
jgi:hypothetical protein